MVFLTIGGWLFVIVLAALGILTAAQRSHQSWTAALGLGCLLACTLGFLGAIPSLLAVAFGGLLALAVIGMVARTPLERREGEHVMADYAGELRGAWESIRTAAGGGVGAGRRAARATRERARTGRHAADELAPRRERKRNADVLPAPALPPADGPVPVRAVPASRPDIPPPFAAVCEWIASIEPDNLTEHVHFLIGCGKGLMGIGESFGTYADNLIHGPGVAPEALKGMFDFADMFSDVSQMAHLANKRVLDYFQGHMEWAETHEPTSDGKWTVRE